MEKEAASNEESRIVTNPVKLALIIFGLVLSIFVAALDETIVATALFAITKDLGGTSETTWVAGAYLLTIVATSPLYGKLSDVFGRKRLMLASLVVMLVGSVCCGLSTSLLQLIVFRAVSGVGAGGLLSLPIIIISEVVETDKKATFIGLLNGCYGFSDVLGPVLGGIFVQYLNWRWVFYINVPLIAVTSVVAVALLPKDPPLGALRACVSQIDFVGIATLVAGIVLVVLGLTWGGDEYAWVSAPVLGSISAGLATMGLFAYYELRHAGAPVVPFSMFNRNVALNCATTLLVGYVMFVVTYHLPLYHQEARGASAMQAGLELLPFVLSISAAAALGGVLFDKIGSCRALLLAGWGFCLSGLCLMLRLGADISVAELILYPTLAGIGVGLNLQASYIGAQCNLRDASEMAAVTAFATFCLNIGGILGLAIQGAVLNNALLRQVQPGHIQQIRDMALGDAYTSAYRLAFVTMAAVPILGMLLTLAMTRFPEKPQK